MFVSSTSSMVNTIASMATLLLWSAFFLRAEPARRAAILDPSSPLARWNEIASTLVPSGSRVSVHAVQVPANDFFLQDVEKVVDRIFIKNSLHIAS
jgi:hypothetical protein